ncbi:mast cell protease 1A-like [Drosophila eugracilis]|uniref:mast cell protease 1A-like n=1 Tax=Drosophila eugracilis TaxID=29029 RepID=UPI001BD9A595|nr:mast cell protease 1A-like [Drosophila eugracilis]
MNDIALLKLEREVPLDDNVKPICIYAKIDSQIERAVDSKRDLRQSYHNFEADGEVSIGNAIHHNVKRCKDEFGDDRGQHIICAEPTKSDMYRGTGGGPLELLTKDSQAVQVGIVSLGRADDTGPQIYTNVLHFTDWIVKEMRK